jgi:hypothetical protein
MMTIRGRNTTMRKTILIAAALSLLAAGAAEAHARLLLAAPRAGETVKASPTALRLSFSETIDGKQSSVTVTGPDGKPVATGPLHADKRLVVVPLPQRLAPGAYKVEWHAMSADMHHTEGDYAFTVKR